MKRKYDFNITQQVSETLAVEIVDDLGQARNLSSYSFKLDCRQGPQSSEAFFSLSSDDGTIVLDNSINNKIWLIFLHELTKTLNFDKGLYDLLAYAPDKSHVEVLMSGAVTLNKTVTRIEN
jgi:hypothetical protein